MAAPLCPRIECWLVFSLLSSRPCTWRGAPMNRPRTRLVAPAALLLLGAAGGLLFRELALPSRAEPPGARTTHEGRKLSPDSAAAFDPNWNKPYPQYQPVGKGLKACPDL